jgi:hypothetical protein
MVYFALQIDSNPLKSGDYASLASVHVVIGHFRFIPI